MASLIRMDRTGHTTPGRVERVDDDAAVQGGRCGSSPTSKCLGYIGTVPDGPGKATHVRELPREAGMVILRRPIAGG